MKVLGLNSLILPENYFKTPPKDKYIEISNEICINTTEIYKKIKTPKHNGK